VLLLDAASHTVGCRGMTDSEMTEPPTLPPTRGSRGRADPEMTEPLADLDASEALRRKG